MPDVYLDCLDPSANLDILRIALRSKTPPFDMRVAVLESEPVAFSILGKQRYEAAPSIVELWALNTHPAHWRKGSGKQLIERAFLDARKQGFASIELWCIQEKQLPRNPYEASDFKPDG